jgi:hypothetical protein
MKVEVGDLMRYRGEGVVEKDASLGLVLGVARATLSSPARYKIWWTVLNKTGWWDAPKVEKVE